MWSPEGWYTLNLSWVREGTIRKRFPSICNLKGQMSDKRLVVHLKVQACPKECAWFKWAGMILKDRYDLKGIIFQMHSFCRRKKLQRNKITFPTWVNMWKERKEKKIIILLDKRYLHNWRTHTISKTNSRDTLTKNVSFLSFSLIMAL